jgi:PAS domain S-box-containing protein
MTRDKNAYRILVIEDSLGDRVIVEDLLMEQILSPVFTYASNFTEASEILSAGDAAFDIILLDLSLPDKGGLDLITSMLKIAPVCPVIILTGYTDIDFSIKSIGQGIFDYLLKDDLTAAALYKSIIYTIERKKNISELKASEKQYSDLFQLSPQPMCLYEMGTYRFMQVNKAAIDHYGYSKKEFLAMTLMDLVPEEDKPAAVKTISEQKRKLNQTYSSISRNYKKNGEIIEVETFSTPIMIKDNETTLVIAIDITEKKQYEYKITKAIIKTQEDERYEIGGELHDNVCQLLAASQMSLAMLKKTIPAAPSPLFDQCKDQITMALDEIRNLSHRLAPAFFGDSTLKEAFERLFKNFNLEEEHEVVLYVDKKVLQHAISMDIQLTMYRILQEQLRNIMKYAKASIIEIDLIVFENKLKMKITDNGIGFIVKEVKNGIGISNMRRRAELFSGKFEIISSPSHGCTVVVDIPLPVGS